MKLNRFNQSIYSSLKYYLKHGLIREYRSWKWVINYYLILIVVVLIASILVINFTHILPPTNTTIAAGQPNSITRNMAEYYQKYFSEHRLKLNIAVVEGSEEGLARLDSRQSEVNAGFYLAGHVNAKDDANIYSLGLVQGAPIWLLYRGKAITDNPFIALSGKKIAIGLSGTVTNSLFKLLADDVLVQTRHTYDLQELAYADARQQIATGKIDAMFAINPIDEAFVKFLMENPEIHVYSFKLADAIVNRHPNLQKLIIPRGSFDMTKVEPKEDLTLLSTSYNLLVQKDVHPAIQWAFLMAAKQYGRQHKELFSNSAKYPMDSDADPLPLSPIAERYYASGVPQVFGSFPIWLANLIDQFWIKALIVLLIYPVVIHLVRFRSFTSNKVKDDSFAYLRYLKIESIETQSAQELRFIIAQIDELISKVNTVWGSDQDAKDFIELVLLAKQIRQEVQDRIASLGQQ